MNHSTIEMKRAGPIMVSLAVLMWCCSCHSTWVDDRQPARDSLKGLRGIAVRVNLSSLDAQPDDPTEREVQASVEKSLTNAGITVIERPSYGTVDNSPTLVVSVGFMNFDIFYYQLSINVTLRQEVRLASNPSLKLSSATWEWGGGGLISGHRKRDEIAEVIDKFICDFRKANPKVKGPLPNCNDSDLSPDLDKPEDKRPTVMTALEDQLIRAATFNEIEEVKSLLAQGADVNAHDPADSTPLSYAVRGGNRPVGDTAVIALLLENGADPNVRMSCRLTPLMNAVNRHDLKVVQLLLDHGADVNASTPEGHTALMAASALGSPDAVSLLLKKGANALVLTRAGQTALTLALANRNRIAPYDRPSLDNPTISIPESDLLEQARNKHNQVINLLENAGSTRR